MAQNSNPFSDFSKMLEGYQGAPFDLQKFLETQRKNMQAITEAQQATMGNMQTIAQRQSEILSQMVEDNSKLAKEIMGKGTPEEKMAKNTKMLKTLYERSVENMKELSEMINKSNVESSNIISKRVSATMNEIQSTLEKEQDKKAA